MKVFETSIIDLTPSAVSVNKSTYTTLKKFTLNYGTWLILASGYFESNSNGSRWIFVTDSSSGTIADSVGIKARATSLATSGAGTGLNVNFIHTVSSSSEDLWLRCYHNSTANSLSTQSCIQALRIK